MFNVINIMAILIYIAMALIRSRRTAIAVLGSSALLIYGSITNSFPVSQAFDKFPKEIIILIIVLALFSKKFESIGVFDYVEERISKLARGKRIIIIIIIISVMCVASMFMNNLSIILLFTFISLELCLRFDLPIIPVLVGGLIASNIGGASLPWADTPAVILTLYTDFSLIDFVNKLLFPCIFYGVVLVIYTVLWSKFKAGREIKKEIIDKKTIIKRHHRIHDKFDTAPHHVLHHKHGLDESKLIGELHHESLKIKKDLNKKELAFPLMLFVLFITGICISPFFDVSIAYVSLGFGAILLFFNGEKAVDILNSIPVLDSLTFITALFLIGGVLEYSGTMTLLVEKILLFTGNNSIFVTLAVLGSAFFIATFLSAGPAAATLLPICQVLNPIVGNNIVYAALALGILSGSSMLPWSATGGPIMLSEVERFKKERHVGPRERKKLDKITSLSSFISFSIPFALIMMIFSSIFLIVYIKVF